MENDEDVLVEPELILSSNQIIDSIIKPILRREEKLSYSALSAFKESPADFIRYKRKQRVSTPAMIYGSMVHKLVLEPSKFYDTYFVMDDAQKVLEIGGGNPRATKVYKEWKAQQQVAAGKKEIVNTADFNMAASIAKGVSRNRAAARILKLCPEREIPIEWDYNNYKWKGFVDGRGNKAKFDLKTMRDAHPKKAQRDIWNMGYYLQAAMYNTPDKEPEDYYIIAVDQKGGISVHLLSPNLMEKGQKEYEYYTNKFTEAMLSDSFDQSFEFFADRYDGIFLADKPW